LKVVALASRFGRPDTLLYSVAGRAVIAGLVTGVAVLLR